MKALALLGLFFTTAAQADPQCVAFHDLNAAAASLGQVPSGSGIMRQGTGAVIVYASPGGATWTMAVIGPSGNACVIASGENWLEVIAPPVPVPGKQPS